MPRHLPSPTATDRHQSVVPSSSASGCWHLHVTPPVSGKVNCFQLIYSYSHVTYIDHGGVHFTQIFPCAVRAVAACCKLPPPELSQESNTRTKEATKENNKGRRRVGNASRAETVFRLALLLYSFVEDTFTQERGSKKGYLLFFLYFSSSSIYLFNIRDIDLHHRIDILSTRRPPLAPLPPMP